MRAAPIAPIGVDGSERRSRSTSFNLLMKPLDDSLLRSSPRNASSSGNPARDTPLPMTMTDGAVV